MHFNIHSGSCAPAERDLSSLATIFSQPLRPSGIMHKTVRDCIKAPPAVTRIQLSDGRMLAFSDYGIPDGKPIFYCHGFPASRLEAQVSSRPQSSWGCA